MSTVAPEQAFVNVSGADAPVLLPLWEKNGIIVLPDKSYCSRNAVIAMGRSYHPLPQNRISVPITYPEVNVTYYLVCKKENRNRFSALFT